MKGIEIIKEGVSLWNILLKFAEKDNSNELLLLTMISTSLLIYDKKINERIKELSKKPLPSEIN